MNSALSGTFGQLLDSWYLKHYVMAVIDDPAEANRALDALSKAGYTGDLVQRWHGHEIVQIAQENKEGKNIIEKAADVIKTGLSDEGLAAKDFEEEAKLGHDIVAIQVEDTTNVKALRDLLVDYNAHHIRASGNWAMEDLD